jgi:hypothetical protein
MRAEGGRCATRPTKRRDRAQALEKKQNRDGLFTTRMRVADAAGQPKLARSMPYL